MKKKCRKCKELVNVYDPRICKIRNLEGEIIGYECIEMECRFASLKKGLIPAKNRNRTTKDYIDKLRKDINKYQPTQSYTKEYKYGILQNSR